MFLHDGIYNTQVFVKLPEGTPENVPSDVWVKTRPNGRGQPDEASIKEATARKYDACWGVTGVEVVCINGVTEVA